MKDMKLSNIQKESEKIKIKKSINEYEDLKAQSLLKLGIMTFDKIRKNKIQDEDFNSICEEIRGYDIEIYTKYMQLRSFEKENTKTTCECGYVAFKNEKFCPQCGNSLIKEEQQYIICPNCEQETEEDSNYCSCCGSKIENTIDIYEDEYIEENFDEEVYCEEENLDFYEGEDIPQVDMIEEDSEKEEIYHMEIVDEQSKVDEDKIEDNAIENEGREFLKNHE